MSEYETAAAVREAHFGRPLAWLSVDSKCDYYLSNGCLASTTIHRM